MTKLCKKTWVLFISLVVFLVSVLGLFGGIYVVNANAETLAVTWGNLVQTNALCLSRTTAPSTEQVLRLSTTEIFVPQSSGYLWYADKYEVYMPLDANGYPFYRYAAAYAGDIKVTGASYLSRPYNVPAFPSTVTRDESIYIPTDYDQENNTYLNVWNHNGSTNKTILGTIAYKSEFYEFGLSIPWIGYRSTSIHTGQFENINGQETEVIFDVRTGPNRISVKANTDIYLTSVNAFAFRLAVDA